MTLAALQVCVLSHQRQPGGVVVERISLRIDFPSLGAVALITGDPEVAPMRGIILPGCQTDNCKGNKEQYSPEFPFSYGFIYVHPVPKLPVIQFTQSPLPRGWHSRHAILLYVYPDSPECLSSILDWLCSWQVRQVKLA